jgi:hypothetical protein
MRVFAPKLLAGFTAVLTFAGLASALEGDLAPATRERLAQRITAREGQATIEKLLKGMVEETGLSVVAPLDVVRMPEPVAIAANDVTAEELIDAIAFVLHLEVMVTPNGVIAFRMSEDDPRRERTLMRYRKSKGQKGEKEGAGRHESRLPPEEVVARVSREPEVKELLERTGTRLFPQKFHPEKRVWFLAARPEEDAGPVAMVLASEDGDLVDIKDGPGEQKGEEKPRPRKPRPKELF